jgi:hypothetical protein
MKQNQEKDLVNLVLKIQILRILVLEKMDGVYHQKIERS